MPPSAYISAVAAEPTAQYLPSTLPTVSRLSSEAVEVRIEKGGATCFTVAPTNILSLFASFCGHNGQKFVDHKWLAVFTTRQLFPRTLIPTTSKTARPPVVKIQVQW